MKSSMKSAILALPVISSDLLEALVDVAHRVDRLRRCNSPTFHTRETELYMSHDRLKEKLRLAVMTEVGK